jgi:predicted ATPase/DNA-binding SARP family transcriptional activator
MALQMRLLGGFEVRCDGVEVCAWPRASAKRLLKLLAVEPRHALSMEEATAALWPNEPDVLRCDQRLHHIIYLLRSALRQGAVERQLDRLLRVRDRVISLSPDVPIKIDVDEFEQQLDLALLDGVDTARLEKALALYRGPLLPEDGSEQWAANARRQLEQRYLGGLHALANTYSMLGNSEGAIALLQRVLKVAPADEQAHRELIVLYGRAGRAHEASRQWADCRAALGRELGTGPSDATKQAYQRSIEPGPSARHPTPVLSNVTREAKVFRPPANLVRLISRERLVGDLRQKLLGSASRLVSLVGLGGVGKTQLAIRVANELQNEYQNGACFVSLAEVGNEGFVDRIARALGLSETPGTTLEDVVTAALVDKQLLLVLDNLEHLVQTFGLITRLLERCPLLTILATSRSRLNLAAELVVAVEPLEYALPAHGKASSPLTAAAALFAERAKAVYPAFEVNASNAADVVAVVRTLGGLPLAIELAAARCAMLSPSALRVALEQDLRVVSGGGPDRHPRQRSLEDSFLWSYRLLPAAAKEALKTISLFAAPFTADLALLVCPLPQPMLIDSIQALIDSGLVAAWSDAGSPHRWLRLHPTARAFALQLHDAEIEAASSRAHFARALADEALRLRQRIRSREAEIVVAAFAQHYDNFIAAMQLAGRENEHETLCRLVQGMCMYWGLYQGGTLAEHWIERALGVCAKVDGTTRGWLFFAVGTYWGYRNNLPAARRCILQALQLAEQLGDRRLIGRSAMSLASATANQFEAVAVLERHLPDIKADPDSQTIVVALTTLASNYLDLGRLAEARATLRANWQGVLELREQERARPTFILGKAAYCMGEHALGLQLIAQSCALEQTGPARPGRLFALLASAAEVYCNAADPAAAQRLVTELKVRGAPSSALQWSVVIERIEAQIELLRGNASTAAERLQRLVEQHAATDAFCGESEVFLWLAHALLHPSLNDKAGAAQALQNAALAIGLTPLNSARVLEVAAALHCAQLRFPEAAIAMQAALALRETQGFARYPAEEPAAASVTAALVRALGTDWPNRTDARAVVSARANVSNWTAGAPVEFAAQALPT